MHLRREFGASLRTHPLLAFHRQLPVQPSDPGHGDRPRRPARAGRRRRRSAKTAHRGRSRPARRHHQHQQNARQVLSTAGRPGAGFGWDRPASTPRWRRARSPQAADRPASTGWPVAAGTRRSPAPRRPAARGIRVVLVPLRKHRPIRGVCDHPDPREETRHHEQRAHRGHRPAQVFCQARRHSPTQRPRVSRYARRIVV